MALLDDVLGIPGNEYVMGRLRELLAGEQAIALVGAGASAGLYPLWDELIRQLAEEPVARGLATDADRDFWLKTATRSPQQAVRGIRESLGRQVFGDVLRETFGYRRGPDGRHCTPVHAALLQLPFRGYVTTNYDPGLLEARLLERPEVGATGYATWQDADAVRRWLTGDVFNEQPCPILYAHGIYEKSDSIVLGIGEYRQAYQAGAFRELVAGLWARERLVFVGFGFSDAWFEMVADEVLTRTAREAASKPRHVAVVGLPEEEAYTPQLRRQFADAYDAEVLLYPVRIIETDGVRRQDHSRLGALLEELGRPFADRQPGRPPVPTEPAVAPEVPAPPQRWVHETTEDERYTQPADALGRLDRWVADPGVRAIAITGIGGLGKTALVGHWLKGRHGAAGRPTNGLLAWSFNANREVEQFFEALLDFAAMDLGLASSRSARLVDAAVAVIRAVPLVVVMDGLEILQEPPGKLVSDESAGLAYGEFLDDDLRVFLDAACRLPHPGLIVLTSRFPFTDLNTFLGSSLRLLRLERLAPAEGAELLSQLDVKGSGQDLEMISRRLDGHPLALRVFAATLARQAHGNPSWLLDAVFTADGLRDNDPLEAKLQQMLSFYRTQLPEAWQILLGIAALFPAQVGAETVLGLARQLPGVAEPFRAIRDTQLRSALAALAGDGLMTKEVDHTGQEQYACHPVVRVYFRAVLLAGDPRVAAEAAGLLTGSISGQIQTIDQQSVVVNAIGFLLDAGEVVQADNLWREQLGNGWAFLRAIPAPRSGLNCVLGFVANEDRREQLRNKISPRRLGFYLSWAGLLARNAGEFELSERFHNDAAEVDRQQNDERNFSIDLMNRCELLIDLGKLADAEVVAQEALDLVKESVKELDLEIPVRTWLGQCQDLQGRVDDAISNFQIADGLRRQAHGDEEGLIGFDAIQWAELYARIGRVRDARRITQGNLTYCETNNLPVEIAVCHSQLGRFDTFDGAYDAAAAHLAQATVALRGSYMLPELLKVLLAQIDLDLHRHAWDDAERHIEQAVTVSASRRMILHHIDALILRGRLYVSLSQTKRNSAIEERRLWAARAQDAADDADTLAQRCGYVWGERDATFLRADAYAALGDAERAHHAKRKGESLARRLQPTIEPT
jgi:tetratricopeptide (TPR) repeat protein